MRVQRSPRTIDAQVDFERLSDENVHQSMQCQQGRFMFARVPLDVFVNSVDVDRNRYPEFVGDRYPSSGSPSRQLETRMEDSCEMLDCRETEAQRA